MRPNDTGRKRKKGKRRKEKEEKKKREEEKEGEEKGELRDVFITQRLSPQDSFYCPLTSSTHCRAVHRFAFPAVLVSGQASQVGFSHSVPSPSQMTNSFA